MVGSATAHTRPGLARRALALLLVPFVVGLQRDHNPRAYVHAGSITPEGSHLRQLIEHRQAQATAFAFPPSWLSTAQSLYSQDTLQVLPAPCF